MDQVPGTDLDAANEHGSGELDQPDVGVADARVEPEEMEPQGVDLIQVTRTAAGDVPDTAELLVNGRGDLAELGAQTGRVVQVLADRDLRSRQAGDVAEVVPQQVGRVLVRREGGRPRF